MENSRETAAEIRYQYICGAYQVMYELASGEDGKTLLAKKTSDSRPVIEKIMPASQGAIYEKLKGLQHPNIVPVWDVAYHGGQCIAVMEYVSGTTLQGLLQEKGYLPVQEAVGILVQLLNGLEFLHGLGMVHRDIHPGNVLVSSDNVVKILDLGIARRVRENCSQDTSILGTVGFAAPEQYGFAQTDGRTDIYSAGVLLNVLLTGRVPSVILVQGRLGQIIQKCIEIAPEKRYGNVASLRSGLLQVSAQLGVNSQQGSAQTGWSSQQEGVKQSQSSKRMRNRMPGFRTGRLWKKIIAVTGYGFMILGTFALVWDAGLKMGTVGVLLELLAMLLVFWVPFLMFSNFRDWDRRLFPFCRWEKDVMIAIRIIVPMFMIYGGLMLDTYARA